MQTPQTLAPAPHQLHLGCGSNYRAGWVNVDANPACGPDIHASGEDLSMLASGSCSVIEACQLLHTMEPEEARAALREWRRLLVPGGDLVIELPNLTRCIELIGTDRGGWDAGLVALFGYESPMNEARQSSPVKWAWTPESLAQELRSAGFEALQQAPVSAAGAPSANPNTDMRLTAKSPIEQSAPVVEEEGEAAFINIFAWPNYQEPAELDHFFNVFARVLVDRGDVCLRLRIDPQADPNRDEVIAALDDSHCRVLGSEAALNVALFEGPITPEEWREAGQYMGARIQLDQESGPREAARQMGTNVIVDAAGLFEFIQAADSDCSNDHTAIEPTAVQAPDPIVPEASTEDRINALHPWHYPLTIENTTVEPGVGSGEDPTRIAYRVGCRSTLLLQEVFSRVDFRGKALLDLGSNCGFWSSFYAIAGATRVLGVDREVRHVAQAELYWEANRFLPIEHYEFLQGDLSGEPAWQTIRQRGQVDITLCAGALHHITNHAEVLGWIAGVTREVMILDTRVQDETGRADDPRTPNRQQLLQTIRSLGFEPEVLPVGFANQVGVDSADSYSEGTRLVILARRAQ